MTERIDVAIIGAGFAGIGIGVRLARRGRTDFAILERAGAVGGTWRDNRYPGVACDIPAQLYGFSFRPNGDWTARYAPGAEIRAYLERTVADEGLTGALRLGTDLQGATWDADAALWRLTTNRGPLEARTLVLACGRLTEPRIPDVPGLGDFRGEVFHSARWRDDVRLAGARVAVVGSGASAIQLVPRLAETAGHLTVLQRSAPYLVPRGDRAFTPAERALFASDPDEVARRRDEAFWRAEEAFAERVGDARLRAAARRRALDHLAAQVPDPALRRLLTPSYEIGCKRVLLSDDYYPALQRDHVDLVPSAVAAFDATGLVAADGTRHDADVVILATGFHAARQPYAALVRGTGGRSLAEHWRSGMTSYASTSVTGFPNLFVLDGPNGGLGHNSAVFMIEAQIEHVLGALAYRAAAGVEALEATPDAEAGYTALLDARSAASVWTTGGCDSWYLDPASGRLTLLWPDFAHVFRDEYAEFDPAAYGRAPLDPSHDQTASSRIGAPE